MLVSELPVMQNSLQIKRTSLVLGLALLTSFTLGQETATEDMTDPKESTSKNQSREETGGTEVPTQFIPKETISPDSVIAFPADI